MAPGIGQFAEHAHVEDLVSTGGKAFHHWQVDRDDFPHGIPQLMMGFTADGQARDDLVAARDARLGVSSAARRLNRTDIPRPDLGPGANAREGGTAVKTRLAETPFRRPPRDPAEGAARPS